MSWCGSLWVYPFWSVLSFPDVQLHVFYLTPGLTVEFFVLLHFLFVLSLRVSQTWSLRAFSGLSWAFAEPRACIQLSRFPVGILFPQPLLSCFLLSPNSYPPPQAAGTKSCAYSRSPSPPPPVYPRGEVLGCRASGPSLWRLSLHDLSS